MVQIQANFTVDPQTHLRNIEEGWQWHFVGAKNQKKGRKKPVSKQVSRGQNVVRHLSKPEDRVKGSESEWGSSSVTNSILDIMLWSQKEEVVPFLGIVKEGFARRWHLGWILKRWTWVLRMEDGDPRGKPIQTRGNDRYQAAEVTAFRIYQKEIQDWPGISLFLVERRKGKENRRGESNEGKQERKCHSILEIYFSVLPTFCVISID